MATPKRPKVLYIEDHQERRVDSSQYLTEQGYDVDAFSKEGLDEKRIRDELGLLGLFGGYDAAVVSISTPSYRLIGSILSFISHKGDLNRRTKVPTLIVDDPERRFNEKELNASTLSHARINNKFVVVSDTSDLEKALQKVLGRGE